MRRRRSHNTEILTKFRGEVVQLYTKFESDLTSLGTKYGYEINMWYSPSKIPQPNFKSGSFLIDIDQLYDDSEFKEIISEQNGGNVSSSSPPVANLKTREFDNDLSRTAASRKKIKYRGRSNQSMFSAGVLDFKQGNIDLRKRRSNHSRGKYG